LTPVENKAKMASPPIEKWYPPETVADRLSKAAAAFSESCRKRREFEVTFDPEHRDFVPPHLQSCEKGEDETNFGESDEERGENEEDPDVNERETDPPSIVIRTVELILERCHRFMETTDLHRRHVVLELTGACLHALQFHTDLLLPQVILF
jgi:hypothetical protein